MATAPIVPTAFREALAQFVTGVTVVTVERGDGLVHGMTANSFTSVSLDPPLILVCVDQRAQLLPLIKEHQRFGVSVLRQEHQALSEYFAKGEQSPEQDARHGVRYRWTSSRVPLLENTLVQLACTLAAAHVAGDHTIFIGEVEGAEIGSGEPLLFFRSHYRRVAP
jgi:flavin reductase (DIM6/NTAB) family NADH-FMN oxidoreductase RutF